jgi:hypothetical protein
LHRQFPGTTGAPEAPEIVVARDFLNESSSSAAHDDDMP